MAVARRLHIRTFPSTELLACLHPTIADTLGIIPNRAWTCTAGLCSTTLQVITDMRAMQDRVHLSEAVISTLKLGGIGERLVGEANASKLAIGPIIGILCNPVWNVKRQTLTQTRQLPVLLRLLESAQRAGSLCCLFRVEDIHFADQSVLAYVHRNNMWKQEELPLPNVIYDQVISRKLERDQDHAKRRLELSRWYGKRIFNDGFFDKWQVYEWLRHDPHLRHHVPHTARYRSQRGLTQFVQKYPVTFLKPIHGSLGLGIIRLTRQLDGSLQFDVKRSHDAPSSGRTHSTVEVLQRLNGRLRRTQYLVQQGIPLATYQDRPFDVRIILQRDGTGEWKRTKMFARVAHSGDFTSNLSSGGEALPVPKVFAHVMSGPQAALTCRRAITRLCRGIAQVMERESGKQFGELGVDIGVDTRAQVWVIEVNAKPWKTPDTEKGRKELVDLSFRRPMEYAMWLAQQD